MQDARQEVEHLQVEVQNATHTQAYMEYLKATIHGEVSTLGETMQILYEEIFTAHKVVVHSHNMQQKCKDNAKDLKVFHIAIASVHEWSMRYKGAHA